MINPKGSQVHCDVEFCENKAVAKNFCPKHYKRWRVYGDPKVNHKRSCKRTKYAINSQELKFTHSHEETMILNEFFEEMVGLSPSEHNLYD